MPNLRPAPAPPPLPANIEDWQRIVDAERSLNDYVEDLHRLLVANDKYRRLIWAAHIEQALEGSLIADDIVAAQMLREKAIDIDNPAKSEKLATIAKCLRVVLRRYGKDRKTQRRLLDGEVIPPRKKRDKAATATDTTTDTEE